jgi:hypothetical protein
MRSRVDVPVRRVARERRLQSKSLRLLLMMPQ